MRWSNSALFVLQQCGEKFRRMYIERDFRPSGPRAKRGTAVHKVASQTHMRQLRGREAQQPKAQYIASVPTEEEARDIAATAFDAAVKEGVSYDEEDIAIGKAKVLGAEKDAAVAMGAHYVRLVAPRVDPVAVEMSTIIRPADTDIEIKGIVDLVTEEAAPQDPSLEGALLRSTRLGRDQPPKLIEVINDLKTGKNPQEDAVEKSQQLAMYALIRTAQTGKPPDKVRLRTITRTKTGKVGHVEQTGVKTTEDLEALAQRLDAAIRIEKAGVYTPANPDSWWCSKKYCAYFTDCKYALGKNRSE